MANFFLLFLRTFTQSIFLAGCLHVCVCMHVRFRLCVNVSMCSVYSLCVFVRLFVYVFVCTSLICIKMICRIVLEGKWHILVVIIIISAPIGAFR